jgi:hypothetical protein
MHATGKSWQQKRCENSDDGNDHEQFHQGECFCRLGIDFHASLYNARSGTPPFTSTLLPNHPKIKEQKLMGQKHRQARRSECVNGACIFGEVIQKRHSVAFEGKHPIIRTKGQTQF